MGSRLRNFGAGAAFVAVTGLGAMGAGWLPVTDAAGAPRAPVAPWAAAEGSDTTVSGLSAAFRAAAKNALPGVVHIRVERAAVATVGRQAPGGNPFGGTPFEDFFRSPPQGPQGDAPQMGSGSGFIFRPDGYILTNNHVVDGASQVTVVLQDKRELVAEVVGRDPNTDVAVVKVDAESLPVLPVGDSDALEVGDWVVALGFPLELGSTVTAGIVSAKGKSLGIIGRDEQASAPLEHFIQTDAAINPGNSGGPLVDLRGRVVGINSAIASPTGYYSGYGFAVPITLATRVASDLIAHGEVRRPKLGVAIRDPSLADAEAAGLDRPFGALVATVEDGSPAARAGLRLNDAIVAVAGQPVESAGDLMELVARRSPGETVSLDVVRQGRRLTLDVELDASFAPSVAARQPEPEAARSGAGRLGLQAADLTPQLAARMRVRGQGVVVTAVQPGSPAGRAGLRPGMIIESVNGQSTGTAAELEDRVQRLKAGSVATLIVRVPADSGESRTVLNIRVGG